MRRTRPVVAALPMLLLSALLACGGSTGPGEDTPDDYVGSWTLAVKARAGCWPDFQIVFEIERDDAATATEARMSIVAQWWFPADPATRTTYTGYFDRTNAKFGLNFVHNWKGAWFAGTDPRAGRLEGTFSDPQGGFQTLTGTLPCVADATATHD